MLLRVDGRRLDPLPALVLLAHGKARNTKVIRDIANDQRAEARIGEERHCEREVHEHRRITARVLYQRFTTIHIPSAPAPKYGFMLRGGEGE